MRRAVITAASLMFCLPPAWPQESDWMKRGWIHLGQTNADNNVVILDPVRIRNEAIYWDAISHICQFGVDCFVIFYLDSDLIPYDLDFTVHNDPDILNTRDELKNASVAFFYYDAEPGKSGLIFACHTIGNEACY